MKTRPNLSEKDQGKTAAHETKTWTNAARLRPRDWSCNKTKVSDYITAKKKIKIS